jgi:hypothetical protein
VEFLKLLSLSCVYVQAYVVLFIYGILNNAVSSSDYVGLNGKIMVNN